ncbi:hypothetical protein L798_05946 [Zootermopsis nevadensis]|uniref:Uncharacterized protein n=1 Tax=Zootermopsis nevadensis TaxID=136037 RepID=A0A067R8P4_ZOONE|nr:hypothetical protein L798_05946 [Zootermopsis nevadensis]
MDMRLSITAITFISTLICQNVVESYTVTGTHLNTSELRRNFSASSEEFDTGSKPSRKNDNTAEKTTQREIYDLLVGILKTFQQSTKVNANMTMEKLAKNSVKPSDHGYSIDQ